MVLIVDDKAENLISLRKFLEQNGFAVDEASSGEQALKKVLKRVYSLIILDVQMPGMDGFEVADFISDYRKAKDTPILFLSAVNIDKQFITKGYLKGAVDYITKPFDPDILLLKVKTFVRLFEQKHQLKLMQRSLKKEIEHRKELESKKDEFLSIASHELKTPLTSARGYIQLIERMLIKENAHPSILSHISKASLQINKLGELVADLLDVSKIASGKMAFNLDEFRFDAMASQVIENFQHVYPDRVFVKKGFEEVKLVGDEMRLEQVMVNFLSNAIKYSPEEMEIHVEISCTDSELELRVKDFGVGISPALQKQLFEKYFRVEETSVRFQGLGIGLFICSEIISRHQGLCGVESEIGQGSTFYFRVPLVPEKKDVLQST